MFQQCVPDHFWLLHKDTATFTRLSIPLRGALVYLRRRISMKDLTVFVFAHNDDYTRKCRATKRSPRTFSCFFLFPTSLPSHHFLSRKTNSALTGVTAWNHSKTIYQSTHLFDISFTTAKAPYHFKVDSKISIADKQASRSSISFAYSNSCL